MEQSLEVIIRTDLETEIPKIIDFNFEELKLGMSAQLEKYKGLVVTEDTIPEAKADRAKLNALITALDDKRKEIRRQTEIPYKAFEVQMKELVALVDAPVSEIDKQLLVFEEKRKAARRIEIDGFYAELASDVKDIIPLAKMWNEKWLNATVKPKEIKTEISARISAVKADLLVLDSIESEYREVTKASYVDTLSIASALAACKRMKDNAEMLRKREEAAKAEKERQAKIAELENNIPASAPVKMQQHHDGIIEQDMPVCEPTKAAPAEPMYSVRFEIGATMAQLKALKIFFIEQNITYRKVD